MSTVVTPSNWCNYIFICLWFVHVHKYLFFIYHYVFNLEDLTLKRKWLVAIVSFNYKYDIFNYFIVADIPRKRKSKQNYMITKYKSNLIQEDKSFMPLLYFLYIRLIQHILIVKLFFKINWCPDQNNSCVKKLMKLFPISLMLLYLSISIIFISLKIGLNKILYLK